MSHTLRPATVDDLPAVSTVFSAARRFMADHGNPTQWGASYPPAGLLESDVAAGRAHVFVDKGGRVHGYVSIEAAPDPTYGTIDGAWLQGGPYATIHRIATDGSFHGALAMALGQARSLAAAVRLDTHADNVPMQRAAEVLGFQRCGTIWVEDGSPRIAYELLG
ncbi:N-acetyltransferase [Olsenella sp. YH-ols2217]|uniref:N-acetyltransferase n=1 Tax=Kribbibacterium absianum TaxID=3044210 RepID=A0ABT6ZLE9_9ACTN|nr:MULTISPECIES: N-acetyltransferase [unclassified Olsenella]MDJ1122549.1 N-acetyltransferase [Olsenella sp. YH-ols2216]MDJ1129491.1 N-acetyltransferase [Olsenella sp. YH-ols2217]